MYGWFTATAPRSWLAHSLVSLSAVRPGHGAFLWFLPPYWHSLGWLAGAAVAAVCYGVKEWGDWRRYQRGGAWLKPRWRGIRPSQDIWGDLCGPWSILAASGLHYLLQWLRTW